MQIDKPSSLGLSMRPVEYRKRFGLCISATLYIPFAQGERGTLWGEQSMWNFLADEMAVPLIDEGVAKLTAEFLVHGRAYPPPGQATACAVRAQVGELEKTLLVFGDRHWDGENASVPQAFEQIPIDWEHAYGGSDFEANPVGKGRTLGDGLRQLPNIESASERLLRPDQTARPAGFGALGVMNPQRTQYRGTYDANYLREHSSGFAPDMDWRFFNVAPPDQLFAQPLRGNEPFAFEHMHLTQPHLAGRLPGLRARVFAGYRQSEGQESKPREVPLRLTTAWFFPHAERAVLLFQGMTEISTDDGSDVLHLLGAVERLGEPKADEHYIGVLAKRSDPRMGAIHTLNDADLLPDGIDTVDPAMEAAQKSLASDQLQAKAQRVRAETDIEMAREQARAQGKDPDALGICMPPPMEPPATSGAPLVAYLEQQIKDAERQKWAVLEDKVTQVEKALAFAEEHKVDTAKLVHRGPPRFSAEGRLADLHTNLAAQGDSFDAAEVYPKLIQQEVAERESYRQAAHMQAPAFPMPTTEAVRLRREMVRAMQIGLNRFAELDFTGADFSGLNLCGANFAGAWLESVNFSQSNLSHANFERAVLSHADLRGAVAVATDFSAANLGGARLAGAVFDDAKFTDATLSRCVFGQTQFRRAQLAGAVLLDTKWGEADWSGAKASGQMFYKLDLKGLKLVEAELAGANFVECDLSDCDLRRAMLQSATFTSCQLDGARLDGAQADGAIFVQDCRLTRAHLDGASLCNANLGGVDMQGATLTRAKLDGTNFTETLMSGCNLRLASAKGALLRRAKLRGAELAGINLHDAVLQHADLRGADLRRGNLFGADLSRVRLDGDSRFDHALLKRARTWPRLTPEQHAATP